MKRFLFSLVLMALLPMMAFAEHVEASRAQKAAQTFLNNNGVKSAQLTDVAPAAGFTNLYIFNANPGFVVMAADDRVQPILGYSLEGQFVVQDMPDNVRWWMQGYDDEIQAAIDHRVSASSETARQWRDLERGEAIPRAEEVVPPLIVTKWNQDEYYNSLCPSVSDGPGGHAYTGCVATAMAQVMKYWEYPSHGIGTHSYIWKGQTLTADFGNTTYDWANMTNTYGSSSTSVQKQAVATLMYHCGVSVDMVYGGRSTNGSSAAVATVAEALKTFFNYSPDLAHEKKSQYDDAEWKTKVKNELDAHRPMEYGGQDPNGPAGHAFVCDGYNSDDYFHFNWGWSGAYDGYFSLDNLDTGANNQSGQGNGVYTRDQAAVFGIQPSVCAAAVPSNLVCTMTGVQNITLHWDAAEGAVSYNIYRNSHYVGNSTDNTYAELAPFGTDDYYVRSVDANGQLSLSSNTVTAVIAFWIPVVDHLEASCANHSAIITWTAPEWCYPETPTATLTYGVQTPSNSFFSWGNNGIYSVYVGHRYLVQNISQYDGMRLYSVDFHASNAGLYEICVYQGTAIGESTTPVTLVATCPVTVSTTGWNKVDLSEPLVVDGSQDLWVFVHNVEPIEDLKSYVCSAEGSDGCFYYYSDPVSYTFNNVTDHAFLIKTHLTDGTYTYNLYRDDTRIANALADTSFVDSNLSLGLHSYYVTTNYYAGESEASSPLSFELAERIVTLDTGWNWWAPQVETAVSDLQNVLGSTTTIMLQNGTATGHLEGGKMYRIHLPDALGNPSLTGIVADLSSIEIPIGYGVNWFGCPGTASIFLADLVIMPALGDKIISQNEGFAVYGPDGWSGTLTALHPQHGYVYVSTAQEAKTLKFYTEMP